MKGVIRFFVISALVFSCAQAFSQGSEKRDSVVIKRSFHDGLSAIDSLNIDADIKINAGVYTQVSASGHVATVTFGAVSAAAAKLDEQLGVNNRVNAVSEGGISEASVFLNDGVGSTENVVPEYRRKGRVVVGARSGLNMGNVMVSR